MNTMRSFRHYSAILLIVMTGGLFSSVAWAATQAGKVAIVRGKATAVSEQGQSRVLSAKAPIYVNDTITTGPNSQAQILFSDETIYTIGPDSDLKIDQFVYDPEKSTGDLVVGATKGSFRMITGSIAKKTPEKVKVRTPVATIGIRGTYLAGLFTNKGLDTLLIGGAIMVQNNAGTSNIKTPGFGSTVKSGSTAPEAPRKFTEEEIKQVLGPTEMKATPIANGSQSTGTITAPAGSGSTTVSTTSTAGDTTTTSTTGDSSTTSSGDTSTASTSTTGETTTASAAGDTSTSATGGTTTTSTTDATTSTTGDPPLTLAAPADTGTTTTTTISTTGTITTYTPPPSSPTTSGTILYQTYSGFTGKYLAYLAPPAPTTSLGSVTASSTGPAWTFTLGAPTDQLITTGPITSTNTGTYGWSGPYAYGGQTLWGLNWPAGQANFDINGQFGFFGGIMPGGTLLAGYAGLPIGAAALPTSGIGVYNGMAANVSDTNFADLDKMKLYINWGNGKVFGSVNDNYGFGGQTFMMGTVDVANKRLTGLSIFGKESYYSTSDFISGSSTLDFYGSGLQGLGGTGSGSSYVFSGGGATSSSTALMAATGNPQAYNLLRDSSDTYNGFVAAIAIPRVYNGDQNLVTLTNTTPTGADKVELLINRTSGTVSGTFNATGTSIGLGTFPVQTHSLAFSLSNSPADSIYIDDDAFVHKNVTVVGTVGGSTPVSTSTNTNNVNFVGTNPNLWNPIPYGHLTWGYWGAEYTTGVTQYDLIPGSYWIAGLLTQNANIPVTGSGTYTGHAMGQGYSATTGLYQLNGTSNITAYFNYNGVAGAGHLAGNLNMTGVNTAVPINWNISFDTTNGAAPFIPGITSPNANSFAGVPITATVNVNGTVSNAAGTLNGAFYTGFDDKQKINVPAGVIGGNWSASGSGQYATGIFVGKK